MIKIRLHTSITVTALTVLILSLLITLRVSTAKQAASTTVLYASTQSTPENTVTLALSNTFENEVDFTQNPPDRIMEYTTHSDVYYYKNGIKPLLERTRALSDTAICHYGLYEIGNDRLALFFADTSNEQETEKLIHLLLCYRDYFPIAVIGQFSEESATLLCSVVELQSAYKQERHLLTSHIEVQENGDAIFDLSLQSTDYTLDLKKPMIALTYDDGPCESTDLLVETYRKHHAKASFYVLGAQVELFEETVINIFRARCEIGNHSNLHEVFSSNTPAIIQKTLEDTNRKLRVILGIGAATVRPPTGALTDRNGNALAVGYPIVLWEIDTKDYEEGVTEDTLCESISSQLKDGVIVLMHDTHGATVAAAERILTTVKDQGYQTVTVSELIEFRLGGADTDTVYRSGSTK